MNHLFQAFGWTALIGFCLAGCKHAPNDQSSAQPSANSSAQSSSTSSPSKLSAEVEAARKRLTELGASIKLDGENIAEISVADGASVLESDIEIIAQQKSLRKLHILNCRALNDQMVSKLVGLSTLNSLALTNTVIKDASVEFIVTHFPSLTELDLSSNTNLTTGVMNKIVELQGLRSLVLVQNRFNELSTRKLKALSELRNLDLRGNMEAGNATLAVVGALPKLTSFKHRSTAVTDDGMEKLAASGTLENLLIQDFMITGMSGQHLAKLTKLKQLEVFRCQGFDSEGVRALQGLGLERLTLRDLPSVDDSAMEVLNDLPKLKRLFLHELETVTDSGLANLSQLKSLEQLDVWTVGNLTDATVEVIAELPNLKELSLRLTGITDLAVDKIIGMPNIQSLTLKENAGVSEAAINKLNSRKWVKLDIGSK